MAIPNPSLLFLLMTLGPASALCAVADRAPNAVKEPLIVFGRVPFAFYVAHVFLFPTGYGLGLPGVYLVWLVVIATLYPFCRWMGSL